MNRRALFLLTFIIVTVIIHLPPNPTTAQDPSEPTLLLQARLSQGTWRFLWSPDSQKIIIYRLNGSLQVLDIPFRSALYQFPENIPIQSLLWSPDSNRIFVAIPDRALPNSLIEVIDITSGQTLFEIGHPNEIYGMRISPDGEQLLVAGEFGTSTVWNLTDGTLAFELTLREKIIRAEWDDRVQRIMTYSDDGVLSVWDMATGDYLFSILHEFPIYGSTWNADGTQLMTFGQDRTARITDVTTGAQVLELDHEAVVNGGYWVMDETRLLTETDGGGIHFWSLNGALLRWLPYRGITFLNNAAQVLSQNEGTLQIWDVETGEEVLAFVHDTFVDGYAVNLDEAYLLSWTTDGDGHIWDVQTGAEHFAFTDAVQIAAWSPDGTMVSVIKSENRLQIWAIP